MVTPFTTPILLLIFNRPDSTMQVFNQIRILKPKQLFIAADGPRKNKIGEAEKCEKVRAITALVDWDCDVKTLYRERNLGCKLAVSSAISWFFDNNNEGIILEDDCVPNQSFFFFCAELLLKYRNDFKVMHIGGINLNPTFDSKDSYYFSRHTHIWGWATWKRAWKEYDVNVAGFPLFLKENRIKKVFGSNMAQFSWLYRFWKVYRNKIDTWDYQWTYSVWNCGGLCISPSKNLVSNIGFHSDASHTKIMNHNVAELKTEAILEINHPLSMVINTSVDNASEAISYNLTWFRKIIYFIIMSIVKRIIEK